MSDPDFMLLLKVTSFIVFTPAIIYIIGRVLWYQFTEEGRKTFEEERQEKEYRKRRKSKWPTRDMYDNYYRTGNRCCLYDEDFKG